MILKGKLFFLFSLTVFAVASFVLNIFNYNPYNSPDWVFVSFFASLFASLIGILGIVIFLIKVKIKKSKNLNLEFNPSIRQAVLISFGVTAIFVLKSFRILDWWVGGPLFIAIILLELFFKTVSPHKKIKQSI